MPTLIVKRRSVAVIFEADHFFEMERGEPKDCDDCPARNHCGTNTPMLELVCASGQWRCNEVGMQ